MGRCTNAVTDPGCRRSTGRTPGHGRSLIRRRHSTAVLSPTSRRPDPSSFARRRLACPIDAPAEVFSPLHSHHEPGPPTLEASTETPSPSRPIAPSQGGCREFESRHPVHETTQVRPPEPASPAPGVCRFSSSDAPRCPRHSWRSPTGCD